MQEILVNNYLLIKAFHIIAVMSWMAAILYLPRIFVYHTKVKEGSESSEIFKIMESKLLRYIMNPAMAVSWILGLTLAYITNSWGEYWFHGKITLLILMQITHVMLGRYHYKFLDDNNNKSERFFRIFNEIPAILMIGIVVLAVIKYF